MATETSTQKVGLAGAVNRALDQAMANNPKVIVMGEDVADEEGGGVFKATLGLSKKYGRARVRSTPIAEEAILGAAIGAAIKGYRPVAEVMLMNFVTVAMDQLFNHAAKLRFMSGGQTHVPLVVRTFTGAGFGTAGQHADMLEAWLAHAAGLKVVMPSCVEDAGGLLLSCIEDDDPCVFVEPVWLYRQQAQLPQVLERIPLSKAKILKPGDDVSIVGYGRTIADALTVAQDLAKEGISAEVLDLRTVSPMDYDSILTSVAKTRRTVVVHEAVTEFGVGAEIAARINEELFGSLKSPVLRVGAYKCVVPFSKPLEAEYMPNANRIAAAVRKVCH